MQIGLLTDSLSTLTRAEALDTAAELGVETVEIGLGGPHGGWSPAPHADLIELLNDSAARTTLRRDITSRGLRLRRSMRPATLCTRSAATATIRTSVARCNSPRNSRSTLSSPCPGFPRPPETGSLPGSPRCGRRRTSNSWNISGASRSTTGVNWPRRPNDTEFASPSRCTPTNSSTTCQTCSDSGRLSGIPSAPTSTPATCCGWAPTLSPPSPRWTVPSTTSTPRTPASRNELRSPLAWKRFPKNRSMSEPGISSPSVRATPTESPSGSGSSRRCALPGTTARCRSRTRTIRLASASQCPWQSGPCSPRLAVIVSRSAARSPGEGQRPPVPSPAIRLTVAAKITAPKRYDNSACLSAVARIAGFSRSVSDTWNVIPIVKAR